MKQSILILIIIISTLNCFGQLQVDAGDDFILCWEEIWPDSARLGGNPTAAGGIAPYTYEWSARRDFSIGTIWASGLLVDTTAANPVIKGIVEDSMTFRLTVTDSIGSQAKDSIKVRFSYFIYYAMDCINFIDKGDTVSLFADATSYTGWEKDTYRWSPDYNISDLTSPSPLAWPDTTTTYFVIVTNSLGCSAFPSDCKIYVNPLDVQSNETKEIKISIVPNPISENSRFLIDNINELNLKVLVYNTSGDLIFEDEIHDNYNIGRKINGNGLYFYIILSDKKIIKRGQFTKK